MPFVSRCQVAMEQQTEMFAKLMGMLTRLPQPVIKLPERYGTAVSSAMLR